MNGTRSRPLRVRRLRSLGEQPAQAPPVEPTFDIEPKEEKSLLERGGSLLNWIGQSVGKAGYGIRGLATGDASAALNFIPFYDTIRSAVGEENLPEATKIEGLEMLQKLGVAPEDVGGWLESPSSFGWRALGLGTEFIDPITLATGPLGSMTTKGLKVAKGVGKAADTAADLGKAIKGFKAGAAGGEIGGVLKRTPHVLAEQIRAGERGVMGLSLPFSGKPLRIGGKDLVLGAGSERMAKAAEWLGYSRPVVAARGAFSHVPGVGGKYTPEAQLAADMAFREHQRVVGLATNIMPAFADAHKGIHTMFNDAMKHAQKTADPAAYRAFEREALEFSKTGVPDPDTLMQMFERHAGVKTVEGVVDDIPKFKADMHTFFDGLRSTEDEVLKRIQDLGGNLKDLDDTYAGHFFRSPTEAVKRAAMARKAGQTGKLGDDLADFQLRRHEAWRNYPGRTAGIERVVGNKTLRGFAEDLEAGALVKLDKQQHVASLHDSLKGLGVQTDPKATLRELQEQFVYQKHILPDLNAAKDAGILTVDQHADEVLRFTQPIIQGTTQGTKTKLKTLPNATQTLVRALNALPESTLQTGLFDKSAVDDWYKYMQSALDMESTMRTAHNFLRGPGVLSKEPAEGFAPLTEVWKDLGFTEEGLEGIARQFDPNLAKLLDEGAGSADDITKALSESISNLHISPKAASGLKGYNEVLKSGATEGLVGAWDNVTSMYKGYLTAFPSFHARNTVSDLWQSIASGEVGVMDILKGYKDVYRHIRTGGKEPSPLFKEWWQLGGKANKSRILDITDLQVADDMPVGVLGGVTDPLMPKSWETLKPWAVGGRVGAKEGVPGVANPWFQAHGKAFNFIESLGRGAHYAALRRKGYSPASAIHIVDYVHFNYSLASPFEKSVMTRAVPFYKWLRNNIPLQLSRLLERPGGYTGQAARLMAGGFGTEEYTPGFMQERMSIPIGGPSTARSFITSSGLPLEDLTKFVSKDGKPAFGETAQRLAAYLHPGITWGPELLADKQLYSGRKISQLQPLTGIPWLDRTLHYSPLSRGIGEMRGMLDERKSVPAKLLNLLSGVKVSTYDTDRLRQFDLEKALMDRAKESPAVSEFTVPYVRREFRGTPEGERAKGELRRLRNLSAVRRRIREQKEAEKAR